MPYCSHCGQQVTDRDVYCGACGARQPVAPPPPRTSDDLLSNVSSRNASLICYIPFVGWIPAIVVLASQRFKRDQAVRFHAFQGIYLFVAWLIVDWAVSPFFDDVSGMVNVGIGGLLKLALFVVWIYMLIKTSQNETVRLPLLGELAERSIAEQS